MMLWKRRKKIENQNKENDSEKLKNQESNSNNEFKVLVEHVEGDGSWILSSQQNVPAIVKWICPICNSTNIRDFTYETLSNPPLGSEFAITFLCDTMGCGYSRAVIMKIDMSLSIEGVLPYSVEEYEKIMKEYEKGKRGKGMRDFIRKHRGNFNSSIFRDYGR